MYALCKLGTFNHRTPGTLAVESFFSDIVEMDPTGKGTSINHMTPVREGGGQWQVSQGCHKGGRGSVASVI